MRRRKTASATIAIATVLAVSAAWWGLLSVRLRDGLGAWLDRQRAAGVRIDTDAPRIAWALRPAVDLGTVTLAGDIPVRLDHVRGELSPIEPKTLILTADGARAAQVLTADAVRARVNLDDGAIRAALSGVRFGATPVDATLTATPDANLFGWTLETSATPPNPLGGLHASGTADAASVTIARATLDGARDLSAEGRFSLDAGRPAGSGVIHARDVDALLSALRQTVRPQPQAERTLRALLGVAHAFSAGDIALPMALKDNLVTVMGVPVARLDLPPMSQAMPAGRSVPD